eukprot:gene30885-33473_t
MTTLESSRRRSASAAPTVVVTIVALAVLLIGEGATALGGGGGGGGGGRGYNDDDNECPFSYNVFVGADDPNPCHELVCFELNWAIGQIIGEDWPECSIQAACCPIIHAYCSLQPDDPECKD